MEQDISGPWHGRLDTGVAWATLAFELRPAPGGGAALLHTRSFGDLDLPLTRQGERLGFAAPALDILLDLSWDGANDRLTGQCRHAGAAYRVAFARGSPPPSTRAPRRQTPTPPFPYEAREVAFEGADGSRLAGTLTLPHTPPPHPAVALSTWFGRTDRDQTTAGHRPFAVWADAFTRRGFATLRYDKRGAGASAGQFDQVTTADSAADLARAVAFLRGQDGVDPARVGLFGHSEGGHVSADVAAGDPRITFCVLLTPSGLAEEETFDTEFFRAARAVGGIPLAPDRTIALFRELAAAAKTAPSEAEVEARAFRILLREAAAGRLPAERIEARAALFALPWRRYWLNHNHTASLKLLTCPVLAVFAERDLQTAPAWHAPPVRAALAGNPLARVIELAGLNHFLQQARTGAPSEYGDIDETLSPDAIASVLDWVDTVRVRAAPG